MASTVTVAFAKATLTVAANPAANETVVISGQTYTFKSALAAANDVLIGADAEASIDNLVAAINDAGGSGYHADTVRNKRCYAKKKDANEMEAYALVPGDIGNVLTVSETLANASSVWDVTTLAGGSGNIGEFIENLFDLNQINSEVQSELRKLTPAAD